MTLLDDQAFVGVVRDLQRQFAVPGVIITVVQDGKSASKGFQLPGVDCQIDEDTMFGIASNTKLFTSSVALGILIEQGQIPGGWGERVCNILPDFAMQDKYAQGSLTLCEMLSHQSGFVGHWLAQADLTHTIDDSAWLYGKQRPATPIRKEGVYDNSGYFLAGLIIERLSGVCYIQFMHDRIFRPLGLLETVFGHQVDESKCLKPYASDRESGEVVEIDYTATRVPEKYWAQSAGGGGIHMTAGDMASWLDFLLKLSRDELPPERRIIQYDTLKTILRGRCLATEAVGAIGCKSGASLWPELSPSLYATAQLVFNYRGCSLASHNGTNNGNSSVLLWLPGRSFAIYAVGNVIASSINLAPAIVLSALDKYLNLPAVDWVARIKALPSWSCKYPAMPGKSAPGNDTVTGDIIGTYGDKLYGKLHVFGPADNGKAATPQVVASLLEKIKTAPIFGTQPSHSPDLWAVFDAPRLAPYYLALYHSSGNTYLGVKHTMFRQGSSDQFNSIPESLWAGTNGGTARFDFAPGVLEFYSGWRETDVGIGRGHATFAKV